MKRLSVIAILVISAWGQAPGGAGASVPQSSQPSSQQSSQSGSPPAAQSAANPAAAGSSSANSSSGNSSNSAATPIDQENARQAKAILQQGIEALGGEAYLTAQTKRVQGRTFSFYHGRATSNGTPFWGFSEFPDKERTEFTQERDIAYLYIGNKGYEITYKGANLMEKKDLVDYLRRRKFSLDVVLRTWVNDPKVALFYDGQAMADQHTAQQVTLINGDNEAVTLFFDSETHLPIKKRFVWRDPTDRQKNIEEESYSNYRVGQGIVTPWDVVRSFNGDTSGQRFLNSVMYNEKLDARMFDPHSGYNPNKPSGKH
jgi:hypothetical protein